MLISSDSFPGFSHILKKIKQTLTYIARGTVGKIYDHIASELALATASDKLGTENLRRTQLRRPHHNHMAIRRFPFLAFRTESCVQRDSFGNKRARITILEVMY